VSRRITRTGEPTIGSSRIRTQAPVTIARIGPQTAPLLDRVLGRCPGRPAAASVRQVPAGVSGDSSLGSAGTGTSGSIGGSLSDSETWLDHAKTVVGPPRPGRRLISLFTRSSGLVLQTFGQCGRRNSVNANTSAFAPSMSVPISGKRPAS
jgi:hypothetical protein